MTRRMWHAAVLCVAAMSAGALHAQTLRLTPGRPSVYKITEIEAIPVTQEIDISLRARLLQVSKAPQHGGELMLHVVLEYYDPPGPGVVRGPYDRTPRLELEIPLASAIPEYGESRRCEVLDKGELMFTYTAGMDEKNFVDFKSAASAREFRFFLNKYICRALAAAYPCKRGRVPAKMTKASSDVSRWRLGPRAAVTLESKNAFASADTSPITVTATGKPFDYTQCERVAPSSGLCCVAGKTTEWHCGEPPTGSGWHQVSGSCFHRETGGSCKE